VIDRVVGQRYRVVRLLGAGGMGSVYEAMDARSGRRVALKLISAEVARNETSVGRFSREARATMAIQTPHIVRVLDAGDDAELCMPFLVMELLEGEDVSHLIKRLGPLPPELSLRILAQACVGLTAAHEARVIHRDLKPANLFLARDAGSARVIKLLDFGIAKIARDPADSKAETAGLTRTGAMLGSPLYMAPEQARGLKEIDRRSDLWSLGVVLYQALTGRTPHQDTEALGELIIAICTEMPPPIQELAPWVPPEVAAIAQRAMRFAPEDRYQSAEAMLADVRALLPRGWEIDEGMLRPLGEAERGRVAQLLAEAPDQPPTRGSRGAERKVTASGAQTLPLAPSAPVTSMDGLGATVAQATPPRSRAALLGGAALALVAGGLLAVEVMGSAPPAPAASAALAAPPPSSAAPAESAPRPRTVRLVILPEGAAVEVDGAPAAVKDGVVEISGALGSVHEVKVSALGEQSTHDVVVAEGGPVPAKIALEGKAPRPPLPTRPAAPRAPSGGPDLRNNR
jgi:serine/threonine-protein kinase